MIAYLSAVRKTSLESNCHIYQKGVWILEEAILLPVIDQNRMEQKKIPTLALKLPNLFS